MPDVADILGEPGQGTYQPPARNLALGEPRRLQRDPETLNSGGDGEEASIEANALRPGGWESVAREPVGPADLLDLALDQDLLEEIHRCPDCPCEIRCAERSDRFLAQGHDHKPLLTRQAVKDIRVELVVEEPR